MMSMRRFIVFILMLALVPAFTQARTSSLQQRIEAERQKSQALQARLHQKRGELNAAASHENDLQSQLDQTNAAIRDVNARIGGLDAQAESTRRKIAWNTVQLNAAQKSLALHDDALKRRLVDIYENGDMSYAAVLLSAHSFTEFVERWEDLRLLIDANETAVRARKTAAAKVNAVQSDLVRTQQELQAQELAQQRAQNQLASLASERRNLVAVADAQRRDVAQQVAQIEDLSQQEEANLEGLIREREQELEQEREAERRARGISAPETATESSPGTFAWPVSGTITSPFGWRSNPFGGSPEFHQGLDIAAPTGTTVTATASGTVILAQWYGGYGNYILIDHGGGFSSGYGHLSAIYVSVGQKVQKGQAIGAVGSTGQSTGPHLHFEIRINGKPVDPAARLHG
ncbi:MAG: peptidoglycan DD-metalloendopeptidase family protein [Candidatus Eremiobacteraeota bacterium]|nr:peptidoglycan DD-metalloendopeptidase family protein [Candidatus Eremiobacteraeota bacterium]